MGRTEGRKLNIPPPLPPSIPNHPARSKGLARAVDRPTNRMGLPMCERRHVCHRMFERVCESMDKKECKGLARAVDKPTNRMGLPENIRWKSG